MQNYENTRAQFEAFIDHATNTPLPSTGTMYWQMNKGWPSLLWDLYNDDGDQAGSYFGVKEANKTLHALYALDNGTVTLDNLGGTTQCGLTVESKVYNLAGTVLDDQTSAPQPRQPAGREQGAHPEGAPTTPAGDDVLRRAAAQAERHVVDRNVYWLSTTRTRSTGPRRWASLPAPSPPSTPT